MNSAGGGIQILCCKFIETFSALVFGEIFGSVFFFLIISCNASDTLSSYIFDLIPLTSRYAK